ncbi:MAG: hydrolase, partial [Syntrophorhabdaceae bacterium]|nr:hydrolase [Syntrophorhabdaceae bacterium]
MERYNILKNLIKREDCLLVFIDIQERLMPAISDQEIVLENAIKLAKFSKIVGLPSVVTEQEKLGKTIPTLLDFLGETDPISKVHFNCFYNNKFSEQIRSSGKKTIVLTGVEAHICITQTAIGGIGEYCIYVIEDAVSSRTRENKKIAIERMRQAGVIISSTEMFIYEILE